MFRFTTTFRRTDWAAVFVIVPAMFFSIDASLVSPSSMLTTVSGRVFDSDRELVNDAQVTLVDVASGQSHVVGTHDRGEFIFTDVALGRYLLHATKAGYVRGSFGADSPGEEGIVLVVDGESIEDLAVRVFRGGVISGLVADADGTPLSGFIVEAIDAQLAANDVAESSSPPSAIVDDRGRYRIFGLRSGQYRVRAMPARIGGSPLSKAGGSSSFAAVRPMRYAVEYFPGVPVYGAAQIVGLGPSVERNDIDFHLVLRNTYSISGSVLGIAGEARTVRVSLGSDAPFSRLATAAVATGASGEFVLTDVPPGQYKLRTEASSAGLSDGLRMWSESSVQVTNHDVSGLGLVLRPTVTLHGRVVLASQRPQLPRDARVALTNIGARIPRERFVVPIKPDGQFEFGHIQSGTYSIAPIFGNAGSNFWVSASASLDGRLVSADEFLVTDAVQTQELSLQLRRYEGAIAGRISDTDGKPLVGVSTVVFPTAVGLWATEPWRLRVVRPDSTGKYEVLGIPAGKYALVIAKGIGGRMPDSSLLQNWLTSSPADVTVVEVANQLVMMDLRQARGGRQAWRLSRAARYSATSGGS